MSSIHLSVFLNSSESHGGFKRSRQLEFRGRENGLVVVSTPLGRDLLKYFFQNPGSWINSLPIIFKLLRYTTAKGVFLGYIFSVWLRDLIHKEKPGELHIEACSGKYLIHAYVATKTFIPSFIYPHNIEFMVPGRDLNLFRSELAAQALELSIYRCASMVNAICDLDLFILRCFSVKNVRVCPYQPVEEFAQWLQNIKFERVKTRKTGYLIMGSVANQPTRDGMVSLLNLIKNSSRLRYFYLAGFGTECLKPTAPSNVEVYGTVSEPILRELMLKCEALLINQSPTTGMLTRIVEAACAGIPVYIFKDYIQAFTICNSNIHIISSIEELPLS